MLKNYQCPVLLLIGISLKLKVWEGKNTFPLVYLASPVLGLGVSLHRSWWHWSTSLSLAHLFTVPVYIRSRMLCLHPSWFNNSAGSFKADFRCRYFYQASPEYPRLSFSASQALTPTLHPLQLGIFYMCLRLALHASNLLNIDIARLHRKGCFSAYTGTSWTSQTFPIILKSTAV